jgi:hypothetical protein
MDSKKPILAIAGNHQFNQFIMGLDRKYHAWMNANMVTGRIFSFNGKYGVVHENLRDPYDTITKRFIAVVQGLLEKNPPFYFDIKSHFSGIDVIKLETNKTYTFDIVSQMMETTDPHGEVYSAEESSILISMIAYKLCFEFAKQERFEAGMRKYQEGMTTLEQSQLQQKIVSGTIFRFK